MLFHLQALLIFGKDVETNTSSQPQRQYTAIQTLWKALRQYQEQVHGGIIRFSNLIVHAKFPTVCQKNLQGTQGHIICRSKKSE